MIGYVKGQVAEVGDGVVIIDNNGIGYEIFVSNSTIAQIGTNQNVKLFTYMNVREDGIFLFGFYTKEEKNMFLKLITVSGVGPKMALGILSGIEINRLMVAIINKDIKTLSKVKGVGKKTAERIIVELKENLDATAAEVAIDDELLPIGTEIMNQDEQDAIYALRGLGFTQSEALKAVKKAKPLAKDLQELIALSLRNLS